MSKEIVDLWDDDVPTGSKRGKSKIRKRIVTGLVVASVAGAGAIYGIQSSLVGVNALKAKTSVNSKSKDISKMSDGELKSARNYYTSLISSGGVVSNASVKDKGNASKVVEAIKKEQDSRKKKSSNKKSGSTKKKSSNVTYADSSQLSGVKKKIADLKKKIDKEKNSKKKSKLREELRALEMEARQVREGDSINRAAYKENNKGKRSNWDIENVEVKNGKTYYHGQLTDGNIALLDQIAKKGLNVKDLYDKNGKLTKKGKEEAAKVTETGLEAQRKNGDRVEGSDSSDGGGTKEAEDSTKRAKTQSNYNGGLGQRISEGVVKEWVTDPRRSEVDPRIFLSEDEVTKALFSSVEEQVNGMAGGQDILVFSSDGVLSFSNAKYRALEPATRMEVLETAIKRIKQSRLPSRIKLLATKFISEQDPVNATRINSLYSDTSAEVAEGYSWISWSFPFLRIVFGFLMIAMVVLSSISIIFDMAYMSLGGLRFFLDRKGKRPKFISPQAYSAVRASEGSGKSGYVDYMGMYLKSRGAVVIFIGVILTAFLGGGIFRFLTWLVEVLEAMR